MASERFRHTFRKTADSSPSIPTTGEVSTVTMDYSGLVDRFIGLFTHSATQLGVGLEWKNEIMHTVKARMVIRTAQTP